MTRGDIPREAAYALLVENIDTATGTLGTGAFIHLVMAKHSCTFEAARDMIYVLQDAGLLRITASYALELVAVPHT
jgi:hypothetical protein